MCGHRTAMDSAVVDGPAGKTKAQLRSMKHLFRNLPGHLWSCRLMQGVAVATLTRGFSGKPILKLEGILCCSAFSLKQE